MWRGKMRGRRVAERVAALFVLLFIAPGCFRVALREKPVDSIEVRFDKSGLCPGEVGQLTIWARTKEGEMLGTENAPDGKVRWDSYRITLNGAPVEDGQVRVPLDPLQVQIPSRVDIAVDGHPNIKTAMTV